MAADLLDSHGILVEEGLIFIQVGVALADDAEGGVNGPHGVGGCPDRAEGVRDGDDKEDQDGDEKGWRLMAQRVGELRKLRVGGLVCPAVQRIRAGT